MQVAGGRGLDLESGGDQGDGFLDEAHGGLLPPGKRGSDCQVWIIFPPVPSVHKQGFRALEPTMQTGRHHVADNNKEILQRIEDLEIRMAFLEKGLADLDQVVQQVATELDFTRQTVKQLREQVQSDSLTVRGDPMEEVPPHY